MIKNLVIVVVKNKGIKKIQNLYWIIEMSNKKQTSSQQLVEQLGLKWVK